MDAARRSKKRRAPASRFFFGVAVRPCYHAALKRREFLIATVILAGDTAMADLPKVQTLDESLRWLDRLEKSPGVRAVGAWPLGAVLEHLAQSIEMSMDGFPEPKSALFQSTAGAAAFAVFTWRGKMSHSLTEPIPGAPALSKVGPWQPAAERLAAFKVPVAVKFWSEVLPRNANGKILKTELKKIFAN